jgi:hypothetical protein
MWVLWLPLQIDTPVIATPLGGGGTFHEGHDGRCSMGDPDNSGGHLELSPFAWWPTPVLRLP